MYKLAKKNSGGPSAAEILEATKKLYVKTDVLKERKIDPSQPRIFKSPSEEEIEELLNIKKVEAFKYTVSNIVSVSTPLPDSDIGLDSNGVTFCITSAPVQYNPLRNSERSAFQPFIKTPPRPPKSAKIRQKLMMLNPTTSKSPPPILPRLYNTQENYQNSSISNKENSGKPIPPPRPSLQKKAERPTPKPRRKTTAFTGFPSNFNKSWLSSNQDLAKSSADLRDVPMGKYSVLSSRMYSLEKQEDLDDLYRNGMVTSMVEVTLKPIDMMSTSWAPDVDFMKQKETPKRLRIPVRPSFLGVTEKRGLNDESRKVVNVSETMDLMTPMTTITPITPRPPKLRLDSPYRTAPSTPSVVLKRSHSSITPLMRSNHSPGATSGIGSGLSERCSSERNSSTRRQDGQIMSSPATSRDSGVPEASGGSSDEFEIQQVDKDFEDRIKRWDSRSVLRRYRSSPKLSTFRAEPFNHKLQSTMDQKGVEQDDLTDQFFETPLNFDEDALAQKDRSKTDLSINREASFLDELHSVEETTSSMFTSVSNRINPINPPTTNELESGADADSSAPGAKAPGNGKQVSVIEKNARVIQWIHGCSLASTVC